MDAPAVSAKHPRLVETSHQQTTVEEIAQVIALLRRRAEEIRTVELARASGKLGALSPLGRQEIEAVTLRVVNELLHIPTVRMEEAAERPEAVRYAAALRHLFGLDEAA